VAPGSAWQCLVVGCRLHYWVCVTHKVLAVCAQKESEPVDFDKRRAVAQGAQDAVPYIVPWHPSSENGRFDMSNL
jgi:hypothetical protein